MSYKLKSTNVFRVETESQAMDLIAKTKDENKNHVVDHATKYKTKKNKGEIVDEWYEVTLTVKYE